MEIKENIVVCDDKAELKGEEPGGAAGSNASGYWTVKTNATKIGYDEGYTSTDFATRVHGLPPGETQFNWHLTRWGCEYDRDMYVYRNDVKADAGKDIYTCENKAQLEGVNPSVGEGHWKFTDATPTGVMFGTTSSGPDEDQTTASKQFNAWTHRLQQGPNPFIWVVENPLPPTGDDGYSTRVIEGCEGHEYPTQEACPDEDEMIVHDLQPDDAVIQTGTEITPTPSPGP